MGRHNKPEELPPPKDKPRYRFVVAISAIFLIAFGSMAIVALVYPEKGPQAEATSSTGGDPFPSISTAPGGVPSPTSTSPASTGPTLDAPLVPAAGLVLGTYAVAQNWAEGFIAGVNLTNATDRPQAWRVEVVFGNGVGVLQSHWIAGGPGDSKVTRVGQTVTFTGTTPLAAGAHIGVSFQFAKTNGDPTPTTCLVNGVACER